MKTWTVIGLCVLGAFLGGAASAVTMGDARWVWLLPLLIAGIAFGGGAIWTAFLIARAFGVALGIRLAGGTVQFPHRRRNWVSALFRESPAPRVDHPRQAFPVTIAAHIGAMVGAIALALPILLYTVAADKWNTPWGLLAVSFTFLALTCVTPFRSEGHMSDMQALLDWWRNPERARHAAYALTTTAEELGDRPAQWSELSLRFAAGIQEPAWKCAVLTRLADRSSDLGEHALAIDRLERALSYATAEWFVATRLALAIARTEAGLNDPATEVAGMPDDPADPFVSWKRTYLKALRSETSVEEAALTYFRFIAAFPGRSFPLEAARFGRLAEKWPADFEEDDGPGDSEDDDQASA